MRPTRRPGTAAGVISGRLVLGFPSGLHLNYLASAIAAFRKAHPTVEFEFRHLANLEQSKAARESKIDVGFVTLPTALHGLEHRAIWRVPFQVVLPKPHPMAKRRAFELADLRNEDFVFCTRESAPNSTTIFSGTAPTPASARGWSRKWEVTRRTCWD